MCTAAKAAAVILYLTHYSIGTAKDSETWIRFQFNVIFDTILVLSIQNTGDGTVSFFNIIALSLQTIGKFALTLRTFILAYPMKFICISKYVKFISN